MNSRLNKFVEYSIWLLILIVASGFSSSLIAAGVGCNDTYVQLASKELSINVTPSNGDDTENIQCALDVANSNNFHKVKLARGTFHISSLYIESFSGSLEGWGMDSTVLQVTDNSVNCAKMIHAGLMPAVIKFSKGQPEVRNLAIYASHPCSDDLSIRNVLHFTGDSAWADNCSNDVIFAIVDRVLINGYELGVGPRVAISVDPEGLYFRTCKNTLLGTFKLNRSEIMNTVFGIATSMRGGAQVDINFNTFNNNSTAIKLFASNQNTTITKNTFNFPDIKFYTHESINAQAGFYDAPPKNRIIINNNAFNITSSNSGENRHRRSYVIQLDANFEVEYEERIVDYSVVINNNKFLLEGPSVIGIKLRSVSNASITTNNFKGHASGAIFIFGSEAFPASGNSITGNTGFSNFFPTNGAAILLGDNANSCIVGPGQSVDISDDGTNNILLN